MLLVLEKRVREHIGLPFLEGVEKAADLGVAARGAEVETFAVSGGQIKGARGALHEFSFAGRHGRDLLGLFIDGAGGAGKLLGAPVSRTTGE